MRKYLDISYYTLKGKRHFLDVGDFAYGEWIIYESGLPKFHINVFDKAADSNVMISHLLTAKKETINSLLKKINKDQNKRLSLRSRPSLGIIKEYNTIELNLIPLPDDWVKQVIK